MRRLEQGVSEACLRCCTECEGLCFLGVTVCAMSGLVLC